MPLTLRDIITFCEPIKVIGNTDAVISSLAQLDSENTDKTVLCWCNLKNVQKLQSIKTGTIIIPNGLDDSILQADCNYIVVENPRQYFNKVLTHFFWKKETASSISNKANIAKSVNIGTHPFIADNVVIYENCIIGDHVRILNNTILYPNTIIGNNVTIGANNVIGNYGFGYEKNAEDNYVLMPHIGNVIIDSEVEIGNNNCIDRAVLGATRINEFTKIHNFVQVAHGVQIGKNCLITAHVTISGGTQIGDGVWIGPGATISNKITIGNSAHLSIGCVVLSNVPENSTIIGNPGRIIKSTNP